MPDDHSEVVPLLPIPNRTVKRLCADDSADSRVKVGHRQAVNRGAPSPDGAFSSALLNGALMRTQDACYNVSLHTETPAAAISSVGEGEKTTRIDRIP